MNSEEATHQDPANPEQELDGQRRAGHSRRAFLFKLSLALNGVVGAILAVPIIGYLVGPAMKKKAGVESWIDLGPLTNFPEGETRRASFRNPVNTAWDGQTADIPCWVRRQAGSTFQVFAINCAHLGCPVRWFEQSKLFMCPCHGGAYYEDGSRASGPPERGLFEYEHKVSGNTLLISAGKMPTLASQCAPAPEFAQITHAETASVRSEQASKPAQEPRCGSCQG